MRVIAGRIMYGMSRALTCMQNLGCVILTIGLPARWGHLRATQPTGSTYHNQLHAAKESYEQRDHRLMYQDRCLREAQTRHSKTVTLS